MDQPVVSFWGNTEEDIHRINAKFLAGEGPERRAWFEKEGGGG